MIGLYVEERTQGSLQSEDDLTAMREALGISEDQIPDAQIVALRPYLTARNQVAHDLDIKSPQDETWGTRYPRHVTTVVKQCGDALLLADAFVAAVSEALGGPQKLGRPTKRST